MEATRRSRAKHQPGDKTALEALNHLAFDAMQLRYPNVPYLVAPKYSDKTANKLTSSIIAWIRLHGYQAERINVTGRQIDQRQTYTDCLGHQRTIGSMKWIPTSGSRGSADISATIKGKSVKIEVKIGRDYQRPDQVKYQRDIEAAGGLYFIASTFEQFHTWYIRTFE